MKVLSVDRLLDGGSLCVETSSGDYYIDDRLGTSTKGYLYKGYPRSDNGNIVDKGDEIVSALKDYFKVNDYSFNVINSFFNEY